MTSVGIFLEHHADVDLLWEQCEEPYGRHHGLELRGGDRDADHILLIGLPMFPGSRVKLPLREKVASLGRGDAPRRKLEAHWRRLGVERERTTVLFYEPTPLVKDHYYEVARAHARKVYGTDARADEQVTLGSMWLVDGDVHRWRAAEPIRKTVPLAAVSSGKRFMPDHGPRLAFFERLHALGVPLEVFGRGLPPAVRSRGSLRSKAAALMPARFALAIEPYAGSPHFVTEKMWDAHLCWCLPLYHGPAAAADLVPPESFIHLPDLGEAGIEVVRETLAKPGLWEARRDAIAEARRRILGDLRMVEWIRRAVVEGG